MPAFPSDIAFRMMEEGLGRPVDEVFSKITPEPIAAASLGQVSCMYVYGYQYANEVIYVNSHEVIAERSLGRLVVCMYMYIGTPMKSFMSTVMR